MRERKLKPCNAKEFDRTIRTLKNNPNHKQFIVLQKGGVRKIIVAGKEIRKIINGKGTIDTGVLQTKQFFAWLRVFNKKIDDKIYSTPHLQSLSIKFKGVNRWENNDMWHQIVGKRFYIIDIQHAYWQMLYRVGYIDKEYYEKYADDDQYKEAKRLCAAFLARETKAFYQKNYGPAKKPWTIECSYPGRQQAFKNIRHELYNILQQASLKFPLGIFKVAVDGAYVTPEYIKQVKEYFLSIGVKTKITDCFKISDNNYIVNGKIKPWKKIL